MGSLNVLSSLRTKHKGGPFTFKHKICSLLTDVPPRSPPPISDLFAGDLPSLGLDPDSSTTGLNQEVPLKQSNCNVYAQKDTV